MTEVSQHINHFMSTLPTHGSFSTWLKQFRPLLTHLSNTHNEMILSHYIYSLVYYSNQISLKYFALIDYLIQSFPSFIRPLESIIEPIFVKTYVWFHHNSKIGDCEQMKSLRFGWNGKFNPQILYGMKVGVWNWIHVDIDVGGGYNGYVQNTRVPKVDNVNSNIDTFQKRRVTDPRQQSLHKRRFIEGKLETNSTEESTNVAPTKVESKLNKLREMAPHKCKLCGMRFSSKINLQAHQKKQMKQNILKFKQKKAQQASKSLQVIIRPVCLQSSKWVDPNPILVKQQQFYFYLKDFKYDNQSCYFCCEEFELKQLEENEEWVYRDCCQVVVEGKDCAMHKSCFELLNEKEEGKAAQ